MVTYAASCLGYLTTQPFEKVLQHELDVVCMMRKPFNLPKTESRSATTSLSSTAAFRTRATGDRGAERHNFPFSFDTGHRGFTRAVALASLTRLSERPEPRDGCSAAHQNVPSTGYSSAFVSGVPRLSLGSGTLH